MPANMYISLPYLPTKYYKKVWKIIIATNVLQTTVKATWFYFLKP